MRRDTDSNSYASLAPSYVFVFTYGGDESTNPIAGMMKRYNKTPLKYALPLFFIGCLVLVSISGCTSSTSPTATATPVATSNPTAAPSTTAGFDPLLAKIATALKPQYSSMVSTRAKNENVSFDGVYVGIENGSTITTVEIRNEGSTENASRTFSVLATPTTAGAEVKDPSKVTLFGETAVTTALGHPPTTVKDVYLRGVGDYQGVDNEYIQYDQIFIDTLVTPST